MMNTKRCSRCTREYPLTAKHFQRSGDGVLRSECKSCTAEADHQRDRKRDKTGPRKIVARAKSANARARALGITGRLTAADIRSSLIQQGGKCFYCGCQLLPGQWDVDHVVPFARGGSNEPGNTVTACSSCNSAKSAGRPLSHVSRLCARGIDSPVRRLFGVSAVARRLPLIFNVEGD